MHNHMYMAKLAICPICKNGVYTRAKGDTMECECGNVRVSQFEDATDVVVESLDKKLETEVITVELRTSNETLLLDFLEMRDCYGRVKDGKKFAKTVNGEKLAYRKRRPFESDGFGMAALEPGEDEYDGHCIHDNYEAY